MQKVVAYKWCDHPECQEEWKDRYSPTNSTGLVGQEVRETEFWVYTPGKGRKPPVIRVELCERHEGDLKVLFSSLLKHDMRRGE